MTDSNGAERPWPTELLVNTLCILSPYDAAEKQAMLEAGTLKDRADTPITLTEMVLAGNSAGQKLGASRLQ